MDGQVDAAHGLHVAEAFTSPTALTDQVAAAADVAKKTVFNYFPTKEDLVYDRADAIEQRLIALVRERPVDMSVVTAFRRPAERMPDQVAGFEPGFHRGSALELATTSPALQRRGLEIWERQASILTAELARDTGRPEWDPVARTVARTMLAAHRSVFLEAHRHIAAGATPKEPAATHPYIGQVFDLLARGLADYPVDRSDSAQ